jgi:hypothetical protein
VSETDVGHSDRISHPGETDVARLEVDRTCHTTLPITSLPSSSGRECRFRALHSCRQSLWAALVASGTMWYGSGSNPAECFGPTRYMWDLDLPERCKTAWNKVPDRLAFYDYLGHNPAKGGLFRTGRMVLGDGIVLGWLGHPTFNLTDGTVVHRGQYCGRGRYSGTSRLVYLCTSLFRAAFPAGTGGHLVPCTETSSLV